MDLRNQRFGIEIEFTGITRSQAAAVVAKHFGVSAQHTGGSYDKYVIYESGREWEILRDSSIRTQRKSGAAAGDEYRVEFVSPICIYEDIETIQAIVRKLRAAGAITNSSCGIHVHVDGAAHTVTSLKNLLSIVHARQDMIYRALDVDSRRTTYCKKLPSPMVDKAKATKKMERLADVWYVDDGRRSVHYNDSRYHVVNLHSYFLNHNIEFRCFNSTLHAGEVKSYIQFSLAISTQAINQKFASSKAVQTDNEKYSFRCWLLRLGLIGEEFKTCRHHLLKHLTGNSAWRYGEPIPA
ncbi:amidoligase family protein [Faecalispora anaeroviscerum]|uniref:amidoligase family protein n=1 Tax=Faecalispora anaeroviscerum TaxID=2991836 RepID=UPI0024B96067|nr:amidoligase family protein [Faecalispora anaeroviscerum]